MTKRLAFEGAFRRHVDADPDLQRLLARLRDLGATAGSAPYQRVERAYLARYRAVERDAHRVIGAGQVAQDRADRAAYMRAHRAAKRAAREAVDARKRPMTETEYLVTVPGPCN